MPNIIVNEGLLAALDEFTANLPATTVLDLYTGPPAITPATVLADITFATFGGYIPNQPLANVTAAVMVGSDARVQWDIVVWEHDGGASVETIEGIVAHDPSAGIIRWIQPRPGGPLVVSVPGQFVPVLPVFTMRSQY